ncbi:G2 and S phase-expressed protein 1 isoform X2 [Gymnodraco acuticeps]|uniref:G2 and S phase-expressed protein 1 isoform X2 n=1 Tax=Gymnodraco acuticeps TaxID=8218 RepID=A0A6P8T5X5_GYMAC|nr:G2 and S phase-expressed protein 1 isoform X2 [Gymnodraco acuticeps]
MDCRANSDMFFLADEKFDFDVSLSPASSKGDEDEDEVFMGPVSHTERCVSVTVASRLENVGGVRASWSPLSEDQLDAVCQEAHRLADQLQDRKPNQSANGTANMATDVTADTTSHRDEFVQDAEVKLGMLDHIPSALSPIKRETFCVQDSPMKQLPPAVQCRLLRGSSSNALSSTQPSTTNPVPSTRPASTTRHSSVTLPSSSRPVATSRLATSMAGGKPQLRMGLRGRAALCVVLPSKPAAPTTSCSSSKSQAVGGWKRSPSSRPSSRAGSSEDLLSDSASVASDISDSSLNSSLQGKRMLAPPTKSAMRNMSGVKAPPLQRRRVTERNNTSSSSSSVSSFNSSISLSPAKGKLNSSLSGPAPSRPANQSRPRRSTVNTQQISSSTIAGRRSMSLQNRKLPEVEPVKAGRSKPLKRSDSTPVQLTPVKRGLEKSTQPLSALRSRSRPEALVLLTPGGGFRGVRNADTPDVSKMLKPKALTSVSSLDSLQKPSGPLTPPAVRSLQVKPQRPSALPTPVKRRMSSIPTPTTKSRASRPPSNPGSDPAYTPSSTRRDRSCCPAPLEMQEAESVEMPVIQPFCLEEEEFPAAPPTSSPQPDQSESTEAGAPSQGQSESTETAAPSESQSECTVPAAQSHSQSESTVPAARIESQSESTDPAALSESQSESTVPAARIESQSDCTVPAAQSHSQSESTVPAARIESQSESTDPAALSESQSETTVPAAQIESQSEPCRNLIEPETKEESHHKTHEFLLLDLPAPTLLPQEKMLIDLSNTPELIRTSSKSCSNSQLIDLTSPLIKWSPEDKRENHAPLINLSF